MFLILILILPSFSVFAQGSSVEANKVALLDAYPGLFYFEGNELVWNDSKKTRMLWDDEKSKTPEQMTEDPDLEDMFHQVYPLELSENPPKDFDPGRYRQEEFFKKLYGSTAAEVSRKVVSVKWMGKEKINVTTVFGIDKKLQAISDEILRLPQNLHKYAKNPGGGFNWRLVSGTKQLSVHSFGAAVDINVDSSDYWKWGGLDHFDNQIPMEIVRIFEKHGFIWGGRWYHYDTMHFEYRPELLELAH